MTKDIIKKAEAMKWQSLALCNNYYYTGQHNKAFRLLDQLNKMCPDDELVKTLLAYICRQALMQEGILDNGLSDIFGVDWKSQKLDGKSITIFCDQGMGDVINLMRYIKQLKNTFDCEIYLNCYSYFNEMKPLMDSQDYIDHFTKEYIKTDFHTNIMSLPPLVEGLVSEVYYPTHFRKLLEKKIPNEPYLTAGCTKKPKSIGFAWRSNPKNSLHKNKTTDPELFQELTKYGHVIYSLHPEESEYDFIESTCVGNLKQTADIINGLDLVISVDTVTLHLAGALGKPVWGLLPKKADPRWGDEETTLWYPSARLYRQEEPNDWTSVAKKVVKDLHLWHNQKC